MYLYYLLDNPIIVYKWQCFEYNGVTMRSTKQIIVIRRDLKCRRGKEISQGCHASGAFVFRKLQRGQKVSLDSLSDAEQAWIVNGYAKVTCQIENETQLLELYQKALAAGLEAHLITDSGKTEFGGIATNTALAIGPDWSDKMDPVTGDLKLY